MAQKNQENVQEKAAKNQQQKKHNPNQQHNSRKEALGPNTRR